MAVRTEKTYLGDGVYAAVDKYDGGIWLTTEDGYSVTNKIYLEPQVYAALERYAARVWPRQEEEDER